MHSQLFMIAILLISIYSLTASAGILSERSGVVNLSLNGYLMVGALGSLMWHSMFGLMAGDVGKGSFIVDFTSMFFGGLLAMVVSILFSMGVINLKGDHVIVGTAINILVASLVFVFLLGAQSKGATYVAGSGTPVGQTKTNPLDGGFNPWFIIYIIFTVLVLAGLWAMVRFTKFGLRLWASGENPNALAATGVSVYKIRWITQLIVGFVTGMGGALFVVYNNGQFIFNVGGMGFIAIAILIMAQWRVHYVMPAAVILAFLQAWISVEKIGLSGPSAVRLFQVIPFIVPVLVLPIFRKVTNMPKHDGQIYDPSKR